MEQESYLTSSTTIILKVATLIKRVFVIVHSFQYSYKHSHRHILLWSSSLLQKVQSFRTDSLCCLLMCRHHIPFSKHLSVQSFLASDTSIMEWHIQGLPTDELSIQNGIIALSAESSRTFIDPQGQGTRWIKKQEAANMLVVSTLHDELLLRHLESSMKCGSPLLIEVCIWCKSIGSCYVDDFIWPMWNPECFRSCFHVLVWNLRKKSYLSSTLKCTMPL